MNAAEMGTHDYMRALAKTMDASPYGERGRLVNEAASFLTFSVAEVYRRLHVIGWRSGRKVRVDRGGSQLTDAELQTVSNIMCESTRDNDKRLLSCENALAVAVANGKVRNLSVTPAHVLKLLKARGLHPEQLAQPAPYISLSSPHPNHTWQIDASVCVLFYLDRKGLAAMPEKEFYKNKPQNFRRVERDRVIRYVVVDHYSGAFYVEYVKGSEDTENLFNFFLNAIHSRGHPQDPLHGVPLQLMDDPGSANTSHLFDNFLTRMQVRHLTHMPGNPRAKGSVESHMNIIERGFEGLLRFGKHVESFEELNEGAHRWMRAYNGTKVHSRHKHTRYGLWQTIREEQLRLAPPRELCRELLRTKPAWARVQRDLTVQYSPPGMGSHKYKVSHIESLSVGDRVEVCVNPYAAPSANLITYEQDGTERLHLLQPITRNAAGFEVGAPVIGESFARQPDTVADTTRKNMLKAAYGVETLREADAAKKARKPAFEGIDAFAHLEASAEYMQRRGVTLPIERPRTEIPPLNHVQAALRLKALGVVMNKDRYARIAALFPQGVREEELDRLAAMFGAGAVEQLPKVAQLK